MSKVDSAAIAHGTPWNIWDNVVNRPTPQTYDETKFCGCIRKVDIPRNPSNFRMC